MHESVSQWSSGNRVPNRAQTAASAEQPERRDNEPANRKHAPCEIGAERRDFGAEHVGRDMLAVLSGLPNGVRDGVGRFGRELGGGQCARDGVRVEHRPIVLRVVAHAAERLPARCQLHEERRRSPEVDPSSGPQPVFAVRWNPMGNDGRNEGNRRVGFS